MMMALLPKNFFPSNDEEKKEEDSLALGKRKREANLK